MPSTYSNLKIQLMATGENTTTWGNVTNTNLGTAIEEAIVGSADVAFSDANVTLTLTDTNTTQSARNMRLNLTGTATAGYNLIVPAIEKPYIINNGTDGTITVKNTTGTGVAVPAGSTMWVFNNGTNVVNVVTYMAAIAGSNTSPSYAFAGDLNTGMWSPAADTIAFSEGGVEAMRIDSSGNVGIGTTSPGAKLDVVGSASFGAAILTGTGLSTGDAQLELGGNRTGSGLAYIDLHAISGGDFQARLIRYGGVNGGLDLIQTGTGGMVITNEGSADTVFKTNATERIRITNAGNVGIGVTSPPQLLAAGNATDQVGAGVSGAVSTVYFGSPSTGSGGIRRLAYDRATGNFDFIGNSVASPTTQMTITAAGNVGIGTTSPAVKLDVIGAIYSRPGEAAGAVAELTADASSGANGISLIAGFTSGGYGPIKLLTSATERMRIDSSGNVGIGTTGGDFGRSWRLVAKNDQNAITNIGVINANTGASASAQISKITGTGNSFVDWGLADNSGSPYDVFSYGSAVQYVSWGFGGSERMRIASNGFVGVGTSTNNGIDKLTVAGIVGAVTSGRCGLHVYNGGATAEWFIGQPSAANPNLTFSKLVSGVYTDYFVIDTVGGITSADAADAVGYKGIPQNSQTATYTLALSDMGKHISITFGGVVIPANSGVAFPIGSAVTIFNNSGSSQTVSITTDTLRLAGTSTTGTRNLAQYGIATVIKVTSTVWVISGAGVS